jgi:hypothetical protein
MLKHCCAIKRSKALGGRSGDAAKGAFRLEGDVFLAYVPCMIALVSAHGRERSNLE